MQLSFTEVDFYKAMLNLQTRATQIAESNQPTEIKGHLAFPVGDGGMKDVLNDIKCLERALVILKNQQS